MKETIPVIAHIKFSEKESRHPETGNRLLGTFHSDPQKESRMRKLVVLFVLLSVPLLAQEGPKAEFFGGYQYLHIGSNSNFVYKSGI